MKIATILCKYDYGIKERGPGLEVKVTLPALKSIFGNVVSFWIEENGFPDDISKLQEKAIHFVKKEGPDIVFFSLMKNEIKKETIQEISRYAETINWFSDDLWRFESFTKYLAPILDYSITMEKHSLLDYAKIGCENKAILSQWAAVDYVKDLDLTDIDYKYDITFVGAKNITREWIISELISTGYNVKCFGRGWDGDHVAYDEMGKIFLKSKINLNISNSYSHNMSFHNFVRKKKISSFFNFGFIKPINYLKNIKRIFSEVKALKRINKNCETLKARTFEIPGYGGFQLSFYALQLEDYYDIGKEIAVYNTLDELKRQIDYYLKYEDTRKEIAIRGYKRTANYTYEKRLKEIFSKIQCDLNK